MKKRLTKSAKDRKIDGVCGGIAEYFNIDSTIVRFALVAFCCIKGFGVLLYIIAVIVMPNASSRDSTYSDDDDIENLKSANMDEKDFEKKKSDKFDKSEKSNSKVNEEMHSDADFDSYFKK